MVVDDIWEINLLGVFDRGVPNRERIVISMNETINMIEFGVLLGVGHDLNYATPIRDNFFWFGNGVVQSGDWIHIYTGSGLARAADILDSKSKIYSVFWGRSKTVFHQPEIVPILFRVGAVKIASTIPAPALGYGQDSGKSRDT